jgi:hypothetical protein
MSLLHDIILYLCYIYIISVKTEGKSRKYNNKVYLSVLELGCNIACGICELHAKQRRLQYRWENLKVPSGQIGSA